MIIKTARMNDLLDWYENLLTKKQRDIMHYYYQQDLSLREIADELNISHNAVYDTITRASKRLEEVERQVGALAMYQQLQRLLVELKSKNIEEIDELIEKLDKL